jgi:hypothetical protein
VTMKPRLMQGTATAGAAWNWSLSRGVRPPSGVLLAVAGVAIPGVAAKLASNEPGRPLIGGNEGGRHAI